MNAKTIKSAITLLAAVFFLTGIAAAMSTVGENGQKLTCQTFVDVSRNAQPAVVSINVKKTMGQGMIRKRGNMNPEELKEFFERRGRDVPDEGFLPFFFPFFEQGEIEIPASGSGVIIRKEGYIVTNNHVIANAREHEISVTLHDDVTIEGDDVEVVGVDELTDLAVIKIKTEKELPALELADSEKLEIGEWVLALGSPLELKGSVSQGIISAKHRVINKAVFEDLIQTTAVINPGNSGGPLVNLDGRIVGINTAIASNTGRWQGVGFAIPSNTVKSICNSIIETGKPKRGWLGIYMAELRPDIKEYFDLEKEKEGIMVSRVIEGSPAEEAGIETYDIITEVEGKVISNRLEMVQQIASQDVGKEVEITLYRPDGRKLRKKTVSVKLGERPSKEETDSLLEAPSEKEEKQDFDTLGLKFREKEKESESEGIEIQEVKSGSPAAAAGLRAGDVIMECNRQKTNTPEDFKKAIRDSGKDRDHIVMYQRGNEILFSTIGKQEK